MEGDCNQEELVWWERYRYEVPISFRAEAGQRYWFSVQAELWNLPQWGRLGTAGRVGCNSVLRSEYFGYPDWIIAADLGGTWDWDASQEFVCYSAIEIQHLALDSTDQEEVPFIVNAAIAAFEHALDPDQTWMEYRTSRPGVWTRVNMQYAGSGHWEAAIPGQQQPKEIGYYIHAEDIVGNTETDPPGGRDAPHGFDVAWFVQPFEERGGDFVVDPDGDDDALEGLWEYADLDTGYAYPYEPREDHTSVGSKCWITARGNESVIGGKTSIQSPGYNLTGATTAKAKYWRWHGGHLSDSGDTLMVQVRNDGGLWTVIDVNTESTQRWVQIEHDLYQTYGDDLGVVDFRFTVADPSIHHIVEAALDDFVILTDLEAIVSVEDGVEPSFASCLVHPNPFRSETTVHFTAPRSCPVRLTVHDVAGRLVATLIDGIDLGAGGHNVMWDGNSDRGHRLQSGIYYVKLNAGMFGAKRHLVYFK